jgi:hypothetical protein
MGRLQGERKKTDRNDSTNCRESIEDVRKNISDRLEQMGQRGHVNSYTSNPEKAGLCKKVLPFVLLLPQEGIRSFNDDAGNCCVVP